MAKGFGGKYFSLQAITATVNATTLHNRAVRIQTCHFYRSYSSDASIDESPPDELDILLDEVESGFQLGQELQQFVAKAGERLTQPTGKLR